MSEAQAVERAKALGYTDSQIESAVESENVLKVESIKTEVPTSPSTSNKADKVGVINRLLSAKLN